MNTKKFQFKNFKLSHKAGAAVMLSLLLAMGAAFAGCSGDTKQPSQPSEPSSVSEQSVESEPESSEESEESEESKAEEVLSADQLEMVKTFAKDVYGSDEVNGLASDGETERDGVAYGIYTFTNANGDEVRLQLAQDAETSGLIFLCEDVDGGETVRRIVYGDTTYIGESVSGEKNTEADLDSFAAELAAALCDDEKAEAEYAEDMIIGGRLMRAYKLPDGRRVAFDDLMNNDCVSASDSETSFMAVVKGEDGYAADETKTFEGRALVENEPEEASDESGESEAETSEA